MDRRSFLFTACGGALAGTALPSATWAQGGAGFPDHALRLIVPLAPGGGTDAVSRLIASEMGKSLGQSVVVENLSGGSGTIGMMAVVRAAPDGYTLLTGTPSLSIDPSLRDDMRFDPLKDLQPVCLFSRVPYVLVSSTTFRPKTMAELLAAAKASPGAITFGSPGIGSGGHLAGELFQLLTGIKLTHIPYKGSGPAMNDLRGGRIDLLFGTTPAVVQFVKAGTLHPLGVSSTTRVASLPDVPTIAESTATGYESYSWYGLWAPGATPAPVVQKLNAAVRTALAQANVKRGIETDGGKPEPTTPEQTGAFLAKEIAKWRDVITKAGLKPE
ncbi:tripartite tricarboxylate transporter substrate binding protein [Bordetella sp. BOR01]|uniref:Bug family tripartite tricarboxylate transporter substrate binding protein n=1 Tax=Bordetella sp. BOR01 TaxID=2854779 RepID=UPI001C4861F4|nr:tripartite tricarboxylate transporter substrate binding protein [Bordetella sp. BOR01]MBV7482214.1 tripartite tricarboxylate transporter substrate binding protein [Bordetella sp. BOR01]